MPAALSPSGDKFYRYHPGSAIGRKLVENKAIYISQILLNPQKGIALLEADVAFGSKNEFWDDFIFSQIFVPVFDQICSLEISLAVNLYCQIDHLLFTLYIRRDEDPVRFRRAFWNLNSYGLHLSNLVGGMTYSKSGISRYESLDRKKRICFVFKGDFVLAHSEFLQEFLVGTKYFSNRVEVFLILIDERIEKLQGKGLDHVQIISFRNEHSYFNKLMAYRKYVVDNNFDHVSWVACVQNLGLYMGFKYSKSQSYWSMKYHSIIMDSLDKYAGLGFGGTNFVFDDIEWYRGRAFPSLLLPKVDKNHKKKLLSIAQIPENSFVIGCFVRSEKLNNPEFWDLLEALFKKYNHIHFVLATQELPDFAKKRAKTKYFQRSFHCIGWVNTKEWCQCLDLYLDSFPRGSCLTILEAIKAKVPTLLFDSKHNRESSALPYLASAEQTNMLPPGVLEIDNSEVLLEKISEYIDSSIIADQLAKKQGSLLKHLEGTNILYAKDYLNYFLDTDLSLKEVKNL